MQVYRFILFCVVCAFCVSCSTLTRTVTKETVKIQHDTVYHNSVQKDSVFFHDSTYTFVKGDTLVVKEYHVKYYDKSRHDTLYITNRDTLVSNNTEVEYRDKEESWWSKTLKRIGIAAIIIMVMILVVKIKNFFI